MQIGGLQKVSLIDYPGKVAAVIFTQGCNFRCPYCHNRQLVLPEYFHETVSEEEVIEFLRERKDKLQGVVLSGGEPTLQKDLIPFLRKIKQFGFAVKLDTNGSQPRVLRQALEAGLVDFIAMDIKGPFERYARLTGVKVQAEDIRTSIAIITQSGVEYLFRTTAVKPLLSAEDIKQAAGLVRAGRRYLLQEFIPRDTLVDTTLLDQGHYTNEEFLQLKKECCLGGLAEPAVII